MITAMLLLWNIASPYSMAGRISEKNEAASMIPAAKLSKPSSSFTDRLLKKKTPRAPTPVIRPAARLHINPIHTIFVVISM
jgi:hypothetical protein